MELSFTKEEIKKIIKLIYLGNWLINSNTQQENRILIYDNILYRFIDLFAKSHLHKSLTNEEIHDEVEQYINKYNLDVFSKEFAKRYADKVCPITQKTDSFKNNILINHTIKTRCEQEIKNNGLKNVNLNITLNDLN